MAFRGRKAAPARTLNAKKSAPAAKGHGQASPARKWLDGNPEWVAAKANRRNLSHFVAVEE